jgi:hypothetical protein
MRRKGSCRKAVLGAALLSLSALLASAAPATAAEVAGTRMRWHRVELRFQGPPASETGSSPNPFLDYRLQCRFTGPSGRIYDVPGFFDTNGAGATSGNIWKCRFAPDQAGNWSYVASFRSGTQVAVSLSATAGTPASFNGDSGTFSVTESDKSGADFRAPARGMIVNDGGHYLVHRGSGSVFLKGGANIPENFLGYSGFDNTPNAGHDFAGHAADWRNGDPDWGNGRGKAIIGALNTLADAGANLIYFLPMNVGGDGNDTFPTVAAQDKTHYDTSKLLQWEQVFTHADQRGIFLHFQLAETESNNENYHDGGTLGVQRKLFYRELIARFGHHLGIEWDLGEENDYGSTKHKAFAAFLRAVDPYDHPVTTHCHTNQLQNFYQPLLGSPDFAMTAFQTTYTSGSLATAIQDWRNRSRNAGVPWVISVDEPQPIENDLSDESRGYPNGRRRFLWPTYMAGGGGFEWYVQEDGGGHGLDQRIENMDLLADAMRWTRIARAFLTGLPLADMTPSFGLSNAQYTLAARGQAYAMYNESARAVSIDLTGTDADFAVTWLNPRTGGATNGGTVSGGRIVDLGSPPFSGDAAVSLVATGAATPNVDCPIQPSIDCLEAEKSKVLIRDDGLSPAKLSWRWKRGDALTGAALGLPSADSSYELCFYDSTGGVPEVVAQLSVPSQSGWRATMERAVYRDRSARFSGVRKLKLKTGKAGKSAIALVGFGDTLTLPAPVSAAAYFAMAPEVTVQLSSSSGVCATSRFDVASRNDPTDFRAVARDRQRAR